MEDPKIEEILDKLKEKDKIIKDLEMSLELCTELYRIINPDYPILRYPDTAKMIQSLCNRILELESIIKNKND